MQFRVRFTLKIAMVAVGVAALVAGVCVLFLRWLLFPHVDVTVFNETTATISELLIDDEHVTRTAEKLGPGGVALTTIQPDDEACISLSYRDSNQVLRKVEPVCYSGNRGSLEIHITPTGSHAVNNIYFGIEMGSWTIKARPTGRMSIR